MENVPLVPEKLLVHSKKILFITHLAIGDFAYLQSCFKVFKQKYPHIKIDLWIDEVRRSPFFWDWKHLRHYALLDWVKESDLFDHIYAGAYSWGRFYKLSRQAKREEYQLVVSLCNIKQSWYARCARKISKKGFVAAVVDEKYKNRRMAKKRLDAFLEVDLSMFDGDYHISQVYQQWFERLFGLTFLPAQRSPFVSIPKEWMSYGKLRFTKWGIAPKNKRFNKVVFVNAFAKNVARCWPVDRLVNLIIALQKSEEFEHAYFIINTEPQFYDSVKAFLSNYCLPRVFLFTAHTNFFQLPAIISQCDLVISVETSVIHLASALKIPVVALMRQKNPEWGPFYKNNSKIILTSSRKGWIEDISCQEVIDGMKGFVSV